MNFKLTFLNDKKVWEVMLIPENQYEIAMLGLMLQGDVTVYGSKRYTGDSEYERKHSDPYVIVRIKQE